MAQYSKPLIDKSWAGFRPENLNPINYLVHVFKMLNNLLGDTMMIYNIACGLTSILGLVVNPFFYSFNLLELLMRYPDLANVLKSVWIPRKSILWTGFLILLLMYGFQLFGNTPTTLNYLLRIMKGYYYFYTWFPGIDPNA